HITNGAYRLHPAEWAVGDAAATVAVFCLRAGVTPQALAARADLRRRVQLLLLDEQIPVYWYDDVPLRHPAFAATQLLAVERIWEGNDADLHFSPDLAMRTDEGKRRIAAAAASIRKWGGTADPESAALEPAPEDDVLPLRRDAAATLIALSVPGATAPEPAAGSGAITRAELAIWLADLVRSAIERHAPAS
ncbi:MAG TPA: FAD-dependent oxidoreductase, partial [bacterium]|nr:FAD-dependent oxidoreductase [bacterium]